MNEETYVILAFGSRENAMRFLARLREAGIPASIRSTPHKIAVGCGLSVRISQAQLPRAKAVLAAEPIPNKGWWRIRRAGASVVVSKAEGQNYIPPGISDGGRCTDRQDAPAGSCDAEK